MRVAKGYSTKDSPGTFIKRTNCPICKIQISQNEYEMHTEECTIRKERMEQRRMERKMGPLMLLKKNRNRIY